MKSGTILLVEDDPSLLALTSAFLRLSFNVLQAVNVAEAQAILTSESVSLVLLDLGLPDEDGMVLARQMRAKSNLPPIIFLTSRKSTLDKISGLDIGGDDYVTKPFEPDELISRIKAVIRRTYSDSFCSLAPKTIKIGFVDIDIESRQVWNSEGKPVHLTKAEYDVFLALVNANGRVLSRSSLLDALSTSPNHDAGERTIDALIAKIRRKMSSGHDETPIIATVQGIGYRLGLVRR